MIGFKYFRFDGTYELTVRTRGNGAGIFRISTDESGIERVIGKAEVSPSKEWRESKISITADGELPLYLHYDGDGSVELLEIRFTK